MKKIAFAFLSLVCVLSLSRCNSSTDSKSDSTTDSTSVTSSADTSNVTANWKLGVQMFGHSGCLLLKKHSTRWIAAGLNT